jgi:F-type H+-transporting ATPase subunit alpha
LELGERVTELMKQAQYSPLLVAEMGFSLFAANEGYLNDVDVKKVVDYEAAMIAYMKSNKADLIAQINESGDYNDNIAAAMTSALDDFKANGVY